MLTRGLDQRHDLPLMPDVGPDRQCAVDLGGDRLRRVAVEIGDHDRRAGGRESGGARASDPGGGAGDHDVLAGWIHRRASLWVTGRRRVARHPTTSHQPPDVPLTTGSSSASAGIVEVGPEAGMWNP